MIRFVSIVIVLILLWAPPLTPDCTRRTIVTNGGGGGEQGNPYTTTCQTGTVVGTAFQNKWNYKVAGEKNETGTWVPCGSVDQDPLVLTGNGACGDHTKRWGEAG
jgi:hypothetical protein